MHLEVTFKNLRPRQEVQRRAQALFQKLARFLDPAAEARLVVAVEHGSARLEMVVSTRGDVLKAVEEDAELRPALDTLFHTMEMQLRRKKERMIDRRHASRDMDAWVPAEPAGDDDFDEASP